MEEVKKEKELKKSKKKNKVASLLLALALILTCGVAGTIAQYQKSFNGQSTATVAKFKVDVTGIQNDTVNLFDTVLDTDNANNYTENDVAKVGGGGANANNLKIAPGTAGYVDLTVTNNSDVSIDYKFELNRVFKDQTDASDITTSASGNVAGNGWKVTEGEIPLEFAVYTGGALSGKQAQQIGGIINGTPGQNNLSDWYTLDDFNAAVQNKTITQLNNTINVGNTTPVEVSLLWRWAFTDNTNTSTKDTRNALDTAIGEAIANDSNAVVPKLNVKLTAEQKD